MSKNVVNPNQLKLFMTGTEWQKSVTHSTDGPIDVVWQEKEQQSKNPGTHHGAGLYQSIQKHGYMHVDPKPTIIFETAPNGKSERVVQSEGHHRVAAAAALERETGKETFIPTNYVDNTDAARRRRRNEYRAYG